MLVQRTPPFGKLRWIIIGAFIALGVISVFLKVVLSPEPPDTLECAGLNSHPEATRCK